MRFFGEIGFGTPEEKRPGVYEDVITERQYYGTVLQTTQNMSNAGTILTDISEQTTISVVADAYALENFMAIKYIREAGTLWTVRTVQRQRPRLILTLGEVYRGPVAAPSNP